ncbi:MAG TPA: helix-turn-helix domain-containing protein [Thermoanaerobaculia bacterium]
MFPVTIPPLRARKEDIDPLTEFFLQRFGRELNKPHLQISDAARQSLRDYSWPGNIRELENCIERAAILCDDARIEPKDLSLAGGRDDRLRDAVDLSGTLEEATGRAVRGIEKIKIEEALQRSASRNEAAELLGISPRTLAAKMKEHGIDEG